MGTRAPTDIEAANVAVVRAHMRVFETRDTSTLSDLVAEDVLIHGATSHVRGRHHVEAAITPPGLSRCSVTTHQLVAAGDRVTAIFTLTYRHDGSGRDVRMSGIKHYRLVDGVIVEFWGETDLYGLLRQLGHVPDEIPRL